MNGTPPRPWQDAGGGWHIDVRGLQPPQPFVAILRLLETIGPGPASVNVRLDRDPLLLYPELAQRGWAAESAEPAEPDEPDEPDAGDAGEVRLRLTRQA